MTDETTRAFEAHYQVDANDPHEGIQRDLAVWQAAWAASRAKAVDLSDEAIAQCLRETMPRTKCTRGYVAFARAIIRATGGTG